MELSNDQLVIIIAAIATIGKLWLTRDVKVAITKHEAKVNARLDEQDAAVEKEAGMLRSIDQALMGYDRQSGALADLLVLKKQFARFEVDLEDKLKETRHDMRGWASPMFLELQQDINNLKIQIGVIEKQLGPLPLR